MLQFSKYQGLGNDFLIIEGRHGQLPSTVLSPDPAWIQRICDRRFGVGGDGLILALPASGDADLRMRIFNADGSEAEMCGNGIRCLARFLADTDGETSKSSWSVETSAGLIKPCLLEDGSIEVDMGRPLLQPAEIPSTLEFGPAGLPQGEISIGRATLAVAAVGMGNPHMVVPVEDLDAIPFEQWGPTLEDDPAFPSRTNVHFLQVHNRQQLEIRVWERGSGPTMACGTGACATLVAAVLLGLCDDVAEVRLPGGSLQISWTDRDGSVLMTGPAEAVFDAVLTPAFTPADCQGLELVQIQQAQPSQPQITLQTDLSIEAESAPDLNTAYQEQEFKSEFQEPAFTSHAQEPTFTSELKAELPELFSDQRDITLERQEITAQLAEPSTDQEPFNPEASKASEAQEPTNDAEKKSLKRVQNFLSGTSLDSLLKLASDSLDKRSRDRK